MKCGISRAVLDQIFAHAAASPDEEVCGLLFGTAARIDAAEPVANVAPEKARRFELDPARLLAAHKVARSGGPAMVGHYHSHPGGRAEPSRFDAEEAVTGSLWLIVAGPEAGLFEAVDEGPVHRRFRQCELEIEA